MSILDQHNLVIGDRMDIVLENGRSFKSRLEDLSTQDYLMVSAPLHKGIPIILHRGQEVGLNYFRDAGRFSFNAKVMGFKLDGEVRLIAFEMLSEPVRHQLRESFRLPVVLVAVVRDNRAGPFPIRPSREDEEEEEIVSTMDVSETGLSFKTKTRYEQGARLHLKVSFGWPSEKTSPLELFGQVRRSEVLDVAERIYGIGVEFIKIDDDSRRFLSRYVLATQQLRLKQKRLVEEEDDE